MFESNSQILRVCVSVSRNYVELGGANKKNYWENYFASTSDGVFSERGVA
jgi:hypothetical protein